MSSEGNGRKRNSTVELLRFFFAFAIMSCHYLYNHGLHGLLVFEHGDLGVEFFFLLSGLLMAQSATKYLGKADKDNVGTLTQGFILRKIKVFLPMLIVVTVIPFLITYAWEIDFERTFCEFFNAIPIYSLLKESGVCVWTYLDLEAAWYLSSMVLGLSILFPLYLLFNDICRKLLFPLIFILCIGFLQQTYGSIIRIDDWVGFTTSGFIRGLGEMALGVVCYDIAIRIRNIDFTKIGHAFILVSELFLIAVSVLYAKGMLYDMHFLTALLVFALMLVLIYSETSLFWIPNGNMVCSFLGSISLPLYLVHLPLLYTLAYFIGWDAAYDEIYLLMAVSILLAIIMKVLFDYLGSKAGSIRRVLVNEEGK